MHDAITDVSGIQVGHAQDMQALTGCSVVLCAQGATVGVEVRGLAPGTRETDLCRPGTLVERAQAVLLSGGSAFGLAAADGVMRFLHERNVGFEVGLVRVPIVPAAVIFDLGLGAISWPDGTMGYEACLGAASGEVAQGCVGAGTGATVGKVLGPKQATKSGLGTASTQAAGVSVGALVVVNAFGNVVRPGSDAPIAGARDPLSGNLVDATALLRDASHPPQPGTNTTIGVVATDAMLNSEHINYLASVAHDGLARTIHPSHTLFDGDTIFGLATGQSAGGKSSSLPALAAAVVEVVERAVIKAVEHAVAAGGLPAMP